MTVLFTRLLTITLSSRQPINTLIPSELLREEEDPEKSVFVDDSAILEEYYEPREIPNEFREYMA